MIVPVWASRASVTAAAALVGTAALFVVSVWRWAMVTPVVPEPTGSWEFGVPSVQPRDTVPADVILAAVNQDPFHPDRRAPATRFRLPGDRPPARQAVVRQPTLPPTLELTGTMVYPDGGGVALLRDRGASRMVRVGERIGAFTLQRVGREEAVFRAPNGRDVVVRVPKAGS